MPKPAHRTKSPAFEASVMPINEQIISQNQSNDGLHGISGRVSGGPLSDANNPIRSKSSKSKTGSKQTGSKSISASEIKAMMAVKGEDSMSTTQKNLFQNKDMRITDGKMESSSQGSMPRKVKSSPDSNGPHRRNHSRSRSRSKVASIASKAELKFAGSAEDLMKGLSGSINYQESSGQEANAPVTSSGDQQHKDPNQSSGRRKGSKKRRLKKSKRLQSLGLAANTDSEAANVIVTSSAEIKKKRGRTKSNGRSGTESSRNQDAIRSKKSLAMITEGSVTRKYNRNSSTQSGIKPATQKSGIKLVGDLIASGRDTQSSKELRHKPLYNENDNFEFYTSEDEFGARVNKLRKKDDKPKPQSTFNMKGVKNTNEDELELYSSFDNQGRRVQKLKKTDGSAKKNNISSNLGGSQRQFTQHLLRSNSNFNIQEEQKNVNNFNFRPQFSQEQSTIKGSVMGASGENFTRFSMVSSRGNLTSANDQVQQKQQARSRSNNAPAPIFNQSTIRVPALEANASQSQIKTHRAGIVERELQTRVQASSALRDAGISVIKIGDSKSKKIQRKKVSAPQRDFSGPYFNHTNFEKAVIATNGRAPYNNKEVEIISKKEKFDPKEFNFKNNWVEAMLNDTKTGHSAPSPAPRPRRVHHDDIASASVTATTVFQGINMNQSSSLQQTIEKPKFGQSQTQQNFNFAGSPVAPRLNPDRNGTELKQISLGMSPNTNGPFPDNVPEIHAMESSGDANARTGNLMYEQAQNYLIHYPQRDLTPPKQNDN